MISIIIATYNAEKTLQTALESVINQKFQDWECIVVDGASKDGTVNIVREYERKDSRIRHISEPDKGIYDAFNKGWKLAKGEWIYYLGADDILLPDAMLVLFDDDESDIKYGDIRFSSFGGKRMRDIRYTDGTLREDKMVSHQCIVMKRSLIHKLDGFDLRFHICADADLLARAFEMGATARHYKVVVAVFNNDGGASSSSINNLREGLVIDLKHSKYSKLYIFANFYYNVLRKKIVVTIKNFLHYE